MNNIVGIKPTVGLSSRHLVIPVSEHQDTVGPMARTVSDAAKLLQVIAGADDNDSYTTACPFKDRYPDYLSACKISGLEGKRIGIPRNVTEEGSDAVAHTMDAFESAISLMANAGATVVENVAFTAYSEYRRREYNLVTRVDFATNLAQYFSKLKVNPRNIRTLKDLRDFTRKCPEEEYPLRDTRTWDKAIDQNISNTSPEYLRAYQQNLYFGGEGGVLGALERHNLDAIILPTAIASSIAALVGTPIITVPLGSASGNTPIKKDDPPWDVVDIAPGVPFGISFLGAKWSEETLIEIAYAFEQKSLVRDTLNRVIQPRVDLADVIGR